VSFTSEQFLGDTLMGIVLYKDTTLSQLVIADLTAVRLA